MQRWLNVKALNHYRSFLILARRAIMEAPCIPSRSNTTYCGTKDGQTLIMIRLANETHAIDQVSFSVSFADVITNADRNRFADRKSDIEREFPLIEERKPMNIAVDRGIPRFIGAPSVYELSLFERNGKKSWSAIWGDQSVQITCMKYSRWSEVWESALKKFRLLLDCLDSQKMIIAIDFAITDVFLADVKFGLQPATIFRKECEFIAPSLLDSQSPLWDQKLGWYEDAKDGARYLIRIDAESVQRNEEYIASLQHTISYRLPGPILNIESLLHEKSQESLLEKTNNEFHSRNKDLLRKMIAQSILKEMGL
ncbi:MAG: hypothetical protein AAGD13_05820 [Pseudomonadota bacterium]